MFTSALCCLKPSHVLVAGDHVAIVNTAALCSLSLLSKARSCTSVRKNWKFVGLAKVGWKRLFGREPEETISCLH